jgi:AraC-like DNA-binding protein
MPDYREFAPPPHLADAVECVWSMHQTGKSAHMHRVVPDGCADILFTRTGGRASLQVVGPMTKFEDYSLVPRAVNLGIRFRPGMLSDQISISADRVTDMLVPLEDLWGARANTLLVRLANAKSINECVSLLMQSLRAIEPRTPVQRAVQWMEQQQGLVSLDDVARHVGVSARHFRRLCIAQTGLSPKFLARVLRFRHAQRKVFAQAGEHAGLAAECGYTDQSHFIAEFRHFSGQTPSTYLHSQA